MQIQSNYGSVCVCVCVYVLERHHVLMRMIRFIETIRLEHGIGCNLSVRCPSCCVARLKWQMILMSNVNACTEHTHMCRNQKVMSSHHCVLYMQEILKLNGYDMQSLCVPWLPFSFLFLSIIPLIDGNGNSERCDINYLPSTLLCVFATGES